jgi:hypothetical protein
MSCRADQRSNRHQDDIHRCGSRPKVCPPCRTQAKIAAVRIGLGEPDPLKNQRFQPSPPATGRTRSFIGQVADRPECAGSLRSRRDPILGNFVRGCALIVMGNRTADVDNLARQKAPAAGICGAMAEQRQADGRNENESAPQKFVHLVGFRDPHAGKAPWVRPGPIAPKS